MGESFFFEFSLVLVLNRTASHRRQIEMVAGGLHMGVNGRRKCEMTMLTISVMSLVHQSRISMFIVSHVSAGI